MNLPQPATHVLVYRRKGDTDPMVGIIVGGVPTASFNRMVNLIYWDHFRKDQWRQADKVPFGENEDQNCLHGLFWGEVQ